MEKKTYKICVCLLFFNLLLFGQSTLKEKLLKDLLIHYNGDLEKQNAATFLLENISIQKSINYKWLDSLGNEVYFSELDYPDLDQALDAFAILKDSISIHPKKYTVKDSEVVTADDLIKNIDLAYKEWKYNAWSQSYDFKTFCEYILPYRSLVEPLEDWREKYRLLVVNAVNKVENKDDPIEVATAAILALKDFRFVATRPDPIPVLSPEQLLFRRSGACADLANLALLACRSIGLAVTFDFTPHNGASSNRHYWNTIMNEEGDYIPFNGNSYGNSEGLPYVYKPVHRRLAKVFRKTFSVQKESVAFYTTTDNIPNSFLREQNLLDVTTEYIPVTDMWYSFLNITNTNVAYLSVFNTGRWRAVDWAKIVKQKAVFKNIGFNLVYLPGTYDNNKIKYERYPVLLKNRTEKIVLKPKYKETFSFMFNQQNTNVTNYTDHNSLDIEDGVTYSLLIWDKRWRKIDSAVAKGKDVFFKNVPSNSLCFIVSKNSNRYERIFTVNSSNHKITWY